MPETTPAAGPSAENRAIFEKLLTIVKDQLELKPEQLQGFDPNMPLVEGLPLDSLAQVTLGAAIEDEFGVILEPEDRERIQTVKDLVEFLKERATKGLP